MPLTNQKGWADIHSRAAVMKRFAKWQAKNKKCVLLLCRDHDPGGLAISEFTRGNLAELSKATKYDNHDFIEAQRLSWIEKLETSSGRRLDDPHHPDHFNPVNSSLRPRRQKSSARRAGKRRSPVSASCRSRSNNCIAFFATRTATAPPSYFTAPAAPYRYSSDPE